MLVESVERDEVERDLNSNNSEQHLPDNDESQPEVSDADDVHKEAYGDTEDVDPAMFEVNDQEEE